MWNNVKYFAGPCRFHYNGMHGLDCKNMEWLYCPCMQLVWVSVWDCLLPACLLLSYAYLIMSGSSWASKINIQGNKKQLLSFCWDIQKLLILFYMYPFFMRFNFFFFLISCIHSVQMCKKLVVRFEENKY